MGHDTLLVKARDGSHHQRNGTSETQSNIYPGRLQQTPLKISPTNQATSFSLILIPFPLKISKSIKPSSSKSRRPNSQFVTTLTTSQSHSPLSAMTDTETILSNFAYLNTLPNIPTENLEPNQLKCPICNNAYQNNTSNRPVQLACSHLIGLHGLARWVFTLTFNNTCPYCPARIILNTSKIRRDDNTTELLVDVLGAIDGQHMNAARRERVLTVLRKCADERHVILFAAYLEALEVYGRLSRGEVGDRGCAPMARHLICGCAEGSAY